MKPPCLVPGVFGWEAWTTGPAVAAFALGLGLVALVEVLPPLGRFIPGQLLVGLAGAAALQLDAFSLWLLLATWAGALAGDALNFARAQRHPKLVLGGRGAWWLPGHQVDHLETGLRRSPWRTYLLHRFLTRDRAILPLAAAARGLPWSRFLPPAATACLVWAAVWITLGAAVTLGGRLLHPAASIVLATLLLLLATRPLGMMPAAPAR